MMYKHILYLEFYTSVLCKYVAIYNGVKNFVKHHFSFKLLRNRLTNFLTNQNHSLKKFENVNTELAQPT